MIRVHLLVVRLLLTNKRRREAKEDLGTTIFVNLLFAFKVR